MIFHDSSWNKGTTYNDTCLSESNLNFKQGKVFCALIFAMTPSSSRVFSAARTTLAGGGERKEKH